MHSGCVPTLPSPCVRNAYPVIIGPTAGGKSDLAVRLAHALIARGQPCEILAADAYQIYRGMDIGTAKPTLDERAGVPHKLIDLVDPRDTFTASDWLALARQTIDECFARGVLPIVVGGTHLYVKLLVDGMFEGPSADEELREQLRAMGLPALRAELERIDPAAAARIHPNDERRTIRAIEVFRLTGKAISEHQKQWSLGTPAFQAGLQPSSSSSTSSWLSSEDVTRLANSDDFGRVAGFVGMNPYPPDTYSPVDQLVVHRRLLPHFALPGATYFVTWKTLHDASLHPEEQQLALDALTFFDGKTCQVYAATVMSNHVHWIVRPRNDTSLDELVTSVKQFSAREINRRRGTIGSVWQAERFDHIIRDERYLFEFLRYCVRNPVEAGACRDAGDYRWTRVHTDVAGSSPGLESRGTQDKPLLVGLDWPVELINRRINLRVKLMMERGFLDEVRQLHEARAFGSQSCEALGYKQLLAHLEGRMSLDEAVEQIKIQTRRFAKNQRTWLKRLRLTPGSVWIDATTEPATWVDVVVPRLEQVTRTSM